MPIKVHEEKMKRREYKEQCQWLAGLCPIAKPEVKDYIATGLLLRTIAQSIKYNSDNDIASAS